MTSSMQRSVDTVVRINIVQTQIEGEQVRKLTFVAGSASFSAVEY